MFVGGNEAIIFAFCLQVDRYTRSEDIGDTVNNMGKEYNPVLVPNSILSFL